MGFVRLLTKLPLLLLYRISDLFFFLVFHVIGYRKKVVLENLKLAFPEKSDKELKTIRRKFYRHFCDLIVEFLSIGTQTEKSLKKRITVTGKEVIDEYFDKDQTIILVVGHFANWEWLLQRACVTYKRPFDAVYQRLSNKGIDDLTIDMRSKFGGVPVEMRQTYKEIVKRRGETRGFCMVADQSPPENKCDHYFNFFGIQTPFYVGMANIAESTKYPVVFAEMVKKKRGHYHVTLKKVAEAPYEKGDFSLVQKFADYLEEQIRKQPELYLWTHRRWKFKK